MKMKINKQMNSNQNTQNTQNPRRVNLLNTRPEGYENLDSNAIRERHNAAIELIELDRADRTGRTENVNIADSIIDMTPITNIVTEVNQEIEWLQTVTAEQQVSNIPVREISRMDNILNESGIVNNVIYYLVQLRDLPLLQRVLLLGGVVVGIVGGIYIIYRIINRTSRVTTIVTPFGAYRPISALGNQDLNIFGRVIKKIGRVLNYLSIKDKD